MHKTVEFEEEVTGDASIYTLAVILTKTVMELVNSLAVFTRSSHQRLFLFTKENLSRFWHNLGSVSSTTHLILAQELNLHCFIDHTFQVIPKKIVQRC